MDSALLIDAIVRQTTVLIAQLATAGGGRAQLAHTANQVFLDLVAALKGQGLGNKAIADMFGMALRTYQTKLQRLSESRTDRGRSLWEALFDFVQQQGSERPIARSELLQRFRHDDALFVTGVLRDLVDSGLVYRTGRGDWAQYGLAKISFDATAPSTEEQAKNFVWMCVHRLAPATAKEVADALSMDPAHVSQALEGLVDDGRIVRSTADGQCFECDSCVLPLGSEVGWEVALFDHYQAMVMAVCAKLASGKRSARASDSTGGSTFTFPVWPEHPYYEEATGWLARFRKEGSALREKIAAYNAAHASPNGEDERVIVYAGQTLMVPESAPEEDL